MIAKAEPPFIVAEVSKQYVNGDAVSDNPTARVGFEQIINHNVQRGYRLHSWKMQPAFCIDPAGNRFYHETIIAVFERSSE